jgi:hypothetical protein
MANPGFGRGPGKAAPARKNAGRGANAEPTSPSDQTPSEIFGAPTDLGSTGLGGSSGFHGSPASDVTETSDQTFIGSLDADYHESHSETTLDGSTGIHAPTGGSNVQYTDPFAFMGYGSAAGMATAQGQIDGDNDWTQAAGKYATGPTLPGIEGNRPTSTGLGEGHVRTERP